MESREIIGPTEARFATYAAGEAQLAMASHVLLVRASATCASADPVSSSEVFMPIQNQSVTPAAPPPSPPPPAPPPMDNEWFRKSRD